ncbi:MAG: Crp/Fnr family transcriptional regulator [Salinivirgaceae bacterium]|nr:Crp/Fnr family transcriptional regulator [Salinivirgaceae bacterium]
MYDSNNPYAQWFNHLTDSQIDIIKKNSVKLNYNKGETICKQGAFASNVFFIERGLMKAYKEYKSSCLIMRFLKQGEVIGFSSLYNKGTYHYTVASVGPTEVLSVTADVVKQLIREDSTFAEMVIAYLNKITGDELERIVSLTQKQLNGRIADAVLHFANNVYKSDEFNMQITRRDVADFCGMSTESAIRILKEFHNDKIVNINGKNMKIISKQLLENLSEFG